MTAIVYCVYCGELMVPHCTHPECAITVCSKCQSWRIMRAGRAEVWRERRAAS